MWKGIPKKLDEFSPIKSVKQTSTFYIFSPKNKGTKQDITRYVENEFGIKIEDDSN